MSYGNVTRMLGMNSGLDTETLVSQMMKAESMKLQRVQKNAMLVSLRQEMYRSVYSDLKSFQKTFLDLTSASSMRRESTFGKQSISVKTKAGQDSGAVSVGAGAKEGKYSVKVSQLAAADLYESAFKIGGDVKSADGFKFDVANIKSGASYEITFEGVSRKVSFREGDAVSGGTLTFTGGSIGVRDADGKVTKLTKEDFIGVFNEKLKSAFGAEGTDGKPKIEARLMTGGGIAISTNGYNSGFSIADGGYVFDIKVATGKSALADGPATGARDLNFTVTTGGVATDISVSVTNGMTQQDLVDSLNQSFADEGLDSTLSFSVNSVTGKIEAKNLDTSEKVEMSGANGSMEYLGFSNGTFELSPDSSLSAGKSALADGPATGARNLKFAITVGDTVTNISVSVTDGMTQQELLKSLNQSLKDKGLESTLFFSIDTSSAAGNIKLTSFAMTEKVKLSGANGSMEYLGFSNGTIELSPSSSLSALGITSGSSAKFSADRKLSEIFGSSLTSQTSFSINGRSFSFTKDTKLSDLVNQVNNANIGVTLRYNEFEEKFELESNSTGYANRISMSGALLTDNLGFGTTARREAADSVATINGVTLTRATNEYEFLGVNWTLNNKTDGDELTVTVAKDTDSVVDNIKKFVDGYNALIEKLNDLSGTSRPKYKGAYYDPLTDDEKKGMTEKEIELWETESKKGLLYRDSIISGITSQLRTALNQSVQLEDGSKISLYSIGITTTSNWTEGGKLEIDEDKLRKAIEVYGDGIDTLFTKTSAEGGKGLAERVNDIVESAISRNGSIARKAGIAGTESEYNNTLYNQLKNYNSRIENMLKLLEKKETNYYNMFAKLEAAMSNSNSQMDYIQSLMGS